VVLGTGYLFLIGALLVPISSGILARPFLESLWLQQSLVAWGQGFPAGHVYLPTVPEWWIVGFYLLLAVGWQLIGTRRTAYWGTCGVLLWTLLLLAAPLLPRPQGPLRCTFLSVGHGLAAVIELPTGETLLYDAGAIGDGLRAERAVENYLWSRGKRSVDAVILSHGDHDHYSGLFGLVEKLPVGALLIGQRFPDPSQRGTMDVCELAAAQGAPIRCLQAGDELRLTGSTSQPVSMKILHPAGGFQSPADNAHSLVLELSYAQRTILLTGDLEKEGLIALLKQPQRQVDVLLAPHHGGKAANVPELYAWARPGMVVVSSGEPSSQRLTQVAEPAELFNTATSGAVTVEIGAHGRVRADEFAPPADR
jgi:competence protein ComEC